MKYSCAWLPEIFNDFLNLYISIAENCEPAKKRRKGILEDAFGPLELDSEEGQRILKSKSIHANKIEQVKIKYVFNSLF